MQDGVTSMSGALAKRREYGVLIDATAADIGGGLTYAKALLPELASELESMKPLLLATPRNLDDLQKLWPHELCVIPLRVTTRLLTQQLLPVLFPSAAVLATGNLGPILYGANRSVVIVQDTRFFGPKPMKPANHYERLQRWFTHRSAMRSGQVIAISQALESNIIHTIPSAFDRITVVRSGAPIKAAPRVPTNGLPSSKFVLSLANGAAHKQLDVVARGWREANIAGLGLTMVGVIPDELRHELLEVTENANGELNLVGPIYEPETVAWYLANAEVLVSASETEAYGLTPVEAGSHGCRTLVTSIPAHHEVCGDHSTYFAVGDANDLARKLVAVLDQPKPAPWTVDVTWKDTAAAVARSIRTVAGP